MKLKENFFYKKKILIYGLGKSGSACFDFLNRNNDILVFDDPLAAVDVHVGNAIFKKCLRKDCQGKTVILVTNG